MLARSWLTHSLSVPQIWLKARWTPRGRAVVPHGLVVVNLDHDAAPILWIPSLGIVRVHARKRPHRPPSALGLIAVNHLTSDHVPLLGKEIQFFRAQDIPCFNPLLSPRRK